MRLVEIVYYDKQKDILAVLYLSEEDLWGKCELDLNNYVLLEMVVFEDEV